MNNFFASVELLDHPELKDKPVAISGDPYSRHGIVLAKNQLAKKAGVITAETIWQARRKCPGLVLLPPHMNKYREYSKKLNSIYMEYTDMVEPFSIDESWLDVTASQKLFGSGLKIANKIRERVKCELGITLSAGVSFNKIFAKMGSEYKKPDATTLINRDNYKELLWPMDVREMFFVGFSTANKLKEIGISTIGDLANSDVSTLEKLLGKQGSMLRSYARGEDTSPVKLFDQLDKIKSVGHGITFKHDIAGENDILTAVTGICDRVAARLRRYRLKASGVKVDIKDPSFKVISRQKQFTLPINTSEDLKQGAMELMKTYWSISKPIRLLTVTAINLSDEEAEIQEQLSLFDIIDEEKSSDFVRKNRAERQKEQESVERTMDEIRKRFGNKSIGFAQLLDNDIGIDL